MEWKYDEEIRIKWRMSAGAASIVFYNCPNCFDGRSLVMHPLSRLERRDQVEQVFNPYQDL